MATVQFDGATIWSDAGTGVGPVVWRLVGKSTRWELVPLVNGTEVLAKAVGTDPVGVILQCEYSMTALEHASALSTIEGKIVDEGTLALPLVGGGTASFTRCVLLDYSLDRRFPERLSGGTMKERWLLVAAFQQTKAV